MERVGQMEAVLSPFCTAYARAVELIGRRWTGAILWALTAGCRRFNEIGQSVPGLSDRLLSERLKELEAEGIVVRTVTPSTPVQIRYALTDKGRALTPVLNSLAAWAETWVDG